MNRRRSYDERRQARRDRRRSGSSTVRVTQATKALLRELRAIIPPYEISGDDELIHELAAAELARRKSPPADPAQLSIEDAP